MNKADQDILQNGVNDFHKSIKYCLLTAKTKGLVYQPAKLKKKSLLFQFKLITLNQNIKNMERCIKS